MSSAGVITGPHLKRGPGGGGRGGGKYGCYYVLVINIHAFKMLISSIQKYLLPIMICLYVVCARINVCMGNEFAKIINCEMD